MSEDTKIKLFLGMFTVLVAVLSAGASTYLAHRAQIRQYFNELRKWGERSCELLSEAVHMCDLDPMKMGPEFFYNIHKLKVSISSQIDLGRWFFPNLKSCNATRSWRCILPRRMDEALEEAKCDESTETGLEKEYAFVGMRQPMLNQLYVAYSLLHRLDYTQKNRNTILRHQFVRVKRNFVSEMQRYLSPRESLTMFGRLTTFRGEPPQVRDAADKK